MENKFVSLIVYLHNDSDNIENFLDTVLPVVKENFSKYELLCVNDDCMDDTMLKLREYVEKNELLGMVSVVHMGYYQGIEASMNAGRDASIGDFVYEFDNAYVDYESSLVFKLYEQMLTGFDIVSASPKGRMSITSKLFYKLFNSNRKTNSDLSAESFRIISRRAINRIKAMGAYIPYRKAAYTNCGLKSSAIVYDSLIPIKERQRIKRSKQKMFERSSLAIDSFIYFTNIMEKISAAISICSLLFSLGTIIYAITDHLMHGDLAEGWASIMCFVSLGFLGVFALLTIMLKYLSLMLDLIFRRQKYLVASIEKIAD